MVKQKVMRDVNTDKRRYIEISAPSMFGTDVDYLGHLKADVARFVLSQS